MHNNHLHQTFQVHILRVLVVQLVLVVLLDLVVLLGLVDLELQSDLYLP
jgi:hypothetical protein